MPASIRFEVNGSPVELAAGPDRSLLWALRTELELTGTKYGCGEGHCGACTVLVGARAVRACQTTIGEVAGQKLTTVEGLAEPGRLDPLQQAFVEHGAFQCGYCTPGMLMAAHALLRAEPHPTRAQILTQLEHHLCRCGAHQRIVAAIESLGGRP